MKNVLIVFATGVFFLVLLIYVSNNLSPWNQQRVQEAIQTYNLKSAEDFDKFIEDVQRLGLVSELIDFRNLLIWMSMALGCVALIFAAVHMFIDKLFFRSFYEAPDMYTAIRRGVVLYFIVIGFIALRLIAGFVWYNALLIVLIALAVEYSITHLINRRKKQND